MKINFFCFLLIHLIIPVSALLGDSVDEQKNSYERFQKENYQEILFIHTDKNYYLAGESIKFKVFCLERLTNTPSSLSRVAYLEILDAENNAHSQAKIELINGSGFGELYLPTSINSANFVLRGYTRWMRNFGPQSYFHTILPIINPFKKLGLSPLASKEEIEIRFYPESGVLINEVETDVVFAIKDKNGSPVNLTGRLMANDTVLVQEIKPTGHGTGKVHLQPNIFQKYHVELFGINGDTTRHSFPSVTGRGLAVDVVDQGNGIEIGIFCNDQGIVDATDDLSLLIDQNGEIIGSYDLKLHQGKTAATVNNSELQDGMYYLTLLKEDGQILAERALFKYTESISEDVISAGSNSARLREKVTVDIASMLAGIEGDSIDVSLSVSTTDKRIGNLPLNMKQYLLLDNAMDGITENLANYFIGQPAEVEENINNLLIMQSANQSRWQLISTERTPKYIPEYRRPIVTGKVTNKYTGEPEYGIMTFLSMPGKNIRFYASRSVSEGKLTFEIDDFYGGNEIVVQNDYTKDTTYTVEIDYPFSREFLEADLPALDIDESLAEWIKSQSQNMQVEFAYQQYRPKLSTLSIIDSSSFYYKPDFRYYLDDYTRFVVMEEVMREYIAGINVRHNRNGFHFMAVDEERNLVYQQNPLMLLDGIPVFDADEIIALDPLKIEKIETVRQRFHKGYLDCQGIVTYTSYEGDLAGHTINKNAISFEYEGIQMRKQYSYPVYSTAYEKNSTIPDFRNTLYWQPNIQLSHKGSSQFDIYTSDYKANYEIRIEGISPAGKVISGRIPLHVEGDPNP